MASAAEIHVMNSALLRLGERPIASPEEGGQVADALTVLFPDVRDTLLSWQAWPFATLRAGLSRLIATPPSDFAYYYALPTQPPVLRLLNLSLMDHQIRYQREIYVDPLNPDNQQAVIATDAETVVMRYVGVTQAAVWTPLFRAAMGVYLAQALCMAITGKAQLRRELLTELYGTQNEPGLLAKLRDIAGHEDSPNAIPLPDTYLAVRQQTGFAAATRYDW